MKVNFVTFTCDEIFFRNINETIPPDRQAKAQATFSQKILCCCVTPAVFWRSGTAIIEPTTPSIINTAKEPNGFQKISRFSQFLILFIYANKLVD